MPTAPFVAPKPWMAPGNHGDSVLPPDVKDEVWRAFVNQEQPIQKQTPLWQPLPPMETVELRMPEGSGFRCVVNPLVVGPETDEWGMRLERWVMTRTVMCSSDGFRTWTEYPHVVYLEVDGDRKVANEATEGTLRQRDADGKVRLTRLFLRSDQEKREATRGPPRELPSVAGKD